jgi:hypothetical protein
MAHWSNQQGLASGLAQGWNLVDKYYGDKADRKRQAEQDKRQAEQDERQRLRDDESDRRWQETFDYNSNKDQLERDRLNEVRDYTRGRYATQDEQAKGTYDSNIATAELNRKVVEKEQAQKLKTEQESKILEKAIRNKWITMKHGRVTATNFPNLKAIQDFNKITKFNIEAWANDPKGSMAARSTILEAIKAGDTQAFNDPKIIAAMNHVYKPQLDGRGENLTYRKTMPHPTKRNTRGEPVTVDLSQGKVVSREIIGSKPADEEGQSFYLEMMVKVQMPDGEVYEYPAPMTQGGDAKPGAQLQPIRVQDLKNTLYEQGAIQGQLQGQLLEGAKETLWNEQGMSGQNRHKGLGNVINASSFGQSYATQNKDSIDVEVAADEANSKRLSALSKVITANEAKEKSRRAEETAAMDAAFPVRKGKQGVWDSEKRVAFTSSLHAIRSTLQDVYGPDAANYATMSARTRERLTLAFKRAWKRASDDRASVFEGDYLKPLEKMIRDMEVKKRGDAEPLETEGLGSVPTSADSQTPYSR